MDNSTILLIVGGLILMAIGGGRGGGGSDSSFTGYTTGSWTGSLNDRIKMEANNRYKLRQHLERLRKNLVDNWDKMFKNNYALASWEAFGKINPEGLRLARFLRDSFMELHSEMRQHLDNWAKIETHYVDEILTDSETTKFEATCAEVETFKNEEFSYIQEDMKKIQTEFEKLNASSAYILRASEEHEKRTRELKKNKPKVYNLYNVLQQFDNRRVQINYQQINRNIEQYREVAEMIMDIDEGDASAPMGSISYDQRKPGVPKNKPPNAGQQKPNAGQRPNFQAHPQPTYSQTSQDDAQQQQAGSGPGKAPGGKQGSQHSYSAPHKTGGAFVPRGNYGNLTAKEIKEIIERFQKKAKSPQIMRKRVLTRLENFSKVIETGPDQETLSFKTNCAARYKRVYKDYLMLQAAYHFANQDPKKDDQFALVANKINAIDDAYFQKYGVNLSDMMKDFDRDKEKMKPEFDQQPGTKRGRDEAPEEIPQQPGRKKKKGGNAPKDPKNSAQIATDKKDL